ncbi:hypothetical protein I3760_13G121800 [Carya illinoinensis]|nr:hypothetical protein I3760_13G121800 [Carya illinoinensis]
MDPSNPSPSSMRVLIRPPPSSSATSSSFQTPLPPLDTPPSSSSQPRSPDGVVVVGVISRRPDYSARLINRVLESNVFGSGNLDKNLCPADKEEVMDWFKWRRISYYHDPEKGILFLQFASTRCPAMDGHSGAGSGFGSAVEEENDFWDLQEVLFMFTVCHVVIYIQEGSRFDTQILKKFRVLQAAKHAFAPFVRSRTTLPLPSRPNSSSSSRPTTSSVSSSNPSPGRSGSTLSRNSSAISLMSGLGSYTSLFPGQCTPVMLFVFVDDFSDVANPSSNVEESTDTSSLNQSSSLSSSTRPSMPVKGSGSVMVLARPVSKSEGGFMKKLQSSLEGQIRFLIKKCRILSGPETSHAGSRSGVASSSAPLFSLDASRAVVLLDQSTIQRCESLECAAGLVEDVLNGKATSDSLLLETHGQSSSKEDILFIKDFIYRQTDILRGRGSLFTNANSGSAAGVGMVAIAAAAAAASAASGKTFTTPELPNVETWLSSSQLILRGLLCAKGGCIDEVEISKRKPRLRNTAPPLVEGSASRNMDPLDVAVSWLECGRGLNTKFSTLWCERALPDAKDVYINNLPACYPTSQHEAHLEKALHAFHSMVKGPAVQLFAKRLENECTSIWKSGRQLCDAVSLTGRPCMHQRHDVQTDQSLLGAEAKPHSSGYVFLHACACGRSRRLQSDPFDFESANINSNCFSDCDKLLPALQLPEVSNAGPIQLSWNLLRIGGARYYEPSKGLCQSGFSATMKFLMKWTISLEMRKGLYGSESAVQHSSLTRSSTSPKVEFSTDRDMTKTSISQVYLGDMQTGGEHQGKPSENVMSDDTKISFGKGLPNFTLRKPFSAVVAGSAAADSGFPPLQKWKQPSSVSEKNKQSRTRDRSIVRVHAIDNHQGSQKSEDILSVQETLNGVDTNGCIDSDPVLQIGSNVIPVNVNGVEKNKLNSYLKHEIMYVGFEHECPHGHRFLLNPEHLNELGPSYSFLEESHIASSIEISEHDVGYPSKSGKNGGHGKVHRNSKVMTTNALSKEKNMDKLRELVDNGNLYFGGMIQFSGPRKEQNQTSLRVSQAGFQSINLDDGACAVSMLNRNLPIFMNCPHCRLSKKKDLTKIKFAGTISQLQRIFLVTPPFPIILATCPIIQFEESCLPISIPDREKKQQFSLGCRVILPPESFLTLKLPFVYGVQREDGSLHPLKPFEHKPELTAWISKGTTLQVMSKGSSIDE